jgi:serine/threonine protein kinase
MTGRYQHIRELGVGGFGVVDACFDNETGSHVAVKNILHAKVHSEAKRLVRELDIMIKLTGRHRHLMGIIDGYISVDDEARPDEFGVHIVMPLMRGDLHRFTRDFWKLPVPDPAKFYSTIAVIFAFHTAFGLDYLHRSNIVHRDLKPDNVLVDVDINDVFQSKAVIADFGLARAAAPTETFYICTRQYRPPEVITNTAKGDASLDMWSLGCVFYELVTARTLFHLPSSLENGQWVGAKASYQLEEILNIVGTPSDGDIDAQPPSNVRSYLKKTRERPSQLRRLFDAHFRLTCEPEEKEMWFAVISGCLEFFPSKRPTATAVCSSALFRRYNILFGENVHQMPPITYSGGATSEVRAENKGKIRALLLETDYAALGRVAGEADEEDDEAAPAPAGAGKRFPELQSEELTAEFAAVPWRRVEDVQAAIDAVTQRFVAADVASDKADLRLLLNFYVGLLPVPPTGEDDGVSQQAVPCPLHPGGQ